MTYKHPEIQEELAKRVKLLAKAQNNPQLQALEIELCKRDILHFFRNYLYTEKNKTIFGGDDVTIIPFVPFPFQEEYILEVWESIIEGNKPLGERKPGVLTNIFVEKSRQMGISWVTMGIFVYGFIFHKHKYTAISRTEEEVDTPGDMDSLFEKIRFMIRNLPDWMIPKDFSKELGKDKSNVFRKITDPHSEASITGKTANPDAGRGGTRHAVFMDEMAFMKDATAINKAAGSNSPCLIYNSTPNGEGNEFYRMREMCFERMDKNTGDIIPTQIKGLRYHWTEHPFYDNEWYKWKTQGKTPEQIAQEYEIDYNTAIEGRVYPEFPTQSMPIMYNPLKPLFVGMDNSHGGQDPNAIIVMQPDGAYWNIIDAIEVYQPPEFCAEYLKGQPRFAMNKQEEEFLKRWMMYNSHKAIFVSDPYDTKSALGSSTILDDYKKNGINLFLPQCRDKQEQILKTRTNLYRVRYNDNCLDFASAIMNAKYPERKEGSNSTSENNKPVHNWTSHFRTALEYLCVYMLENPILEKKKVQEDERPRRDMVTGRLIYNN